MLWLIVADRDHSWLILGPKAQSVCSRLCEWADPPSSLIPLITFFPASRMSMQSGGALSKLCTSTSSAMLATVLTHRVAAVAQHTQHYTFLCPSDNMTLYGRVRH